MRRLVLFMPMTEDEAVAATAWGRALGNNSLTVEYRPSPTPMRVLLFDGVTRRDGLPRRAKARVMNDPFAPAGAALRSATATGDVVFNVITAHSRDPSVAYPGTDAVFTVALPEGAAVAWFARVNGGIAPGIANSCLRLARDGHDTKTVSQSARLLFFKRPLPHSQLMEHERRVIAFARERLAEVS